MTTDAARKAVFNTPELLENFISFVPLADILTKVQRLSRQWKEAVDSSPVIKNQLFTRVPSVTAVQPTSFSDEHSFPLYTFWVTLNLPIYSHAVTFNPVVSKGVNGCWNIYSDDRLQPEELKSLNGDTMHPKLVDFTYSQPDGRGDHSTFALRSSWRDMYLTDPPITTAVLFASNHEDREGEFGPRDIRMSVRDHDGLTLGLHHDTIIAGLPSSVREKLDSTDFWWLGLLCFALAEQDMSGIGDRVIDQPATV